MVYLFYTKICARTPDIRIAETLGAADLTLGTTKLADLQFDRIREHRAGLNQLGVEMGDMGAPFIV